MRIVVVLCLLTITGLNVFAQRGGSLNSRGSRHVGFNVDGDTKVGYAKIFPTDSSYYYEDDWFSTSEYTPNAIGRGQGIIETSNAASLKAQLVGGANISFTKRMAAQPYDIKFYLPPDSLPGKYSPQFWVDGVYFRDYVGTDATSFLSGAKNGANPNNWSAGSSSVSDKADIIDAYCHVRTSGRNPSADSVWFFGGIATKGNNGARYFDIEVYREPIVVSGNKFVSQGTSYGHSHWAFDANSNIIQTGDLVISVEYANNDAPLIDFRIWLKKSTYDSITSGKIVPKTFKLQGRWNAADDPNYGYAEITAPNATDVWGTGLGNYTANASKDSTYSTPWGTINASGVWSETYSQLQFVEISLNFSRFGMNPFSYVTSYCKSPYSSILFKSRNSPAFDASLNDFVGPVDFSIKSMAPFTVTPEVLTCTKTTSKLMFNYDARNYYRLINSVGDTLNKDVDFFMYPQTNRFLPVTTPGTYRVEATNFQGCPTMGSQTVTVLKDDIAPDGTVLIGNAGSNYTVNINPTTDGTATFGPSGGYTYSWGGPLGSTLSSTTAKTSEITTYVEGTYHVTVTEARNGCTAYRTAYIMGVLKSNVQLSGKMHEGSAQLIWNNPDAGRGASFIVERSYNGQQFQNIGVVTFSANSPNTVSYQDATNHTRAVYYRIKNQQSSAYTNYSNMILLTPGAQQQSARIFKSNNAVQVQLDNCIAKTALVQVLDMSGRLITQQSMPVTQGTANALVALPAGYENKAVVVMVTGDGLILETKKVL